MATGERWSVDYVDNAITRTVPSTPAGLGPRFVARIIDNITGAIVGIGVAAPVALIAATLSGARATTLAYAGLAFVLGALVYETASNRTGGGFGKRLLRLRIRRHTEKARPGRVASFIRAFMFVGFGAIPFAGTFLIFGDLVWAVWDEDRQTWHDHLAGTWVVPASGH